MTELEAGRLAWPAAKAWPHIKEAGGQIVTGLYAIPGYGFLVAWDSRARDLIGNTPFLVRIDGTVRSTWPREFNRYFPDSIDAVLEVEDDGKTADELEAETRDALLARGIPDPGPGPEIRIVPRGSPMGRWPRVPASGSSALG